MTKIDILKAVREEAKGFTSTREAGFNFIFDSAVSVEISDRKASKLAEDIINEDYEACAKRFGKDILETLLADIRTFTSIEEKMPTYELWADTFDVSEANKDGFIAQALKQGFAYDAERAEGLDCMWTITLRKAPEGFEMGIQGERLVVTTKDSMRPTWEYMMNFKEDLKEDGWEEKMSTILDPVEGGYRYVFAKEAE